MLKTELFWKDQWSSTVLYWETELGIDTEKSI